MNELQHLHPELFRRVRVKAIVFIGLGLSLLIMPSVQPTKGNTVLANTVLSGFLTLKFWGAVALTIGMFILWGSQQDAKHNYKIARWSLFVAFGYAVMWLLALFVSFLYSRQTGSVLVIWAYLTYNLFVVATDPGWNLEIMLRAYGKRRDARE